MPSVAAATRAENTEYNLGDALGKGPDSERPSPVPDDGFKVAMRKAMDGDCMGKAIKEHPEAHPTFRMSDRLG